MTILNTTMIMTMMLMINDNDDGNTDVLNSDKGCDENVNANNVKNIKMSKI